MSIFLALMFRDSNDSTQFGSARWAALREVEQLFSLARTSAAFKLAYLATSVPEGLALPRIPLAPERLAAALGDESFWADSEGRFIGTYRSEPLGRLARQLLGIEHTKDSLVVLTDQELSDPNLVSGRQRYIIFSNYGDDTRLISLATLDPRHWGHQDDRRVVVLKQRTRAACCRMVGDLTGLPVCRTFNCFLKYPLTNPTLLDQLILVCNKHKDDALALKGYILPDESNLTAVQMVQTFPEIPGG